MPIALIGAAQLRADGISSCCDIVNVPQPSVESYVTSHKEGMVQYPYSSSPMLSLWLQLSLSGLLIRWTEQGRQLTQKLTTGKTVKLYNQYSYKR